MKKTKIARLKVALEALHLNLYVSEVIITVQGYVVEQGKERLEIDNMTRAFLEKEKDLLKSKTMRTRVQSESGKNSKPGGQMEDSGLSFKAG